MNRMHAGHDEGGELFGHALVPRAEPQCGARFLDSRRADSSAGSGAHAVLPIQPRRDHTLAADVTRYAATTGVVLLDGGLRPAGCRRPEVTSGPTISPTAPSLSTLAGSQLTEVIVDGLIARSGPGIGGDSEIYPGTIPGETRLWLYDGPVTVAGYEWYHVVPEHGTLLLADGSDDPVSDAWVAAGSSAGEAWLQTSSRCVRVRRASRQSQTFREPRASSASATSRSDSRAGSIRSTAPVAVAEQSRGGSLASWRHGSVRPRFGSPRLVPLSL